MGLADAGSPTQSAAVGPRAAGGAGPSTPGLAHPLPAHGEAVHVLENHPLIGRTAEQGFGELVISHGMSGYLALYSYEVEQDIVLVLAVRHQREAGFVSE